jgi:anti-sigma-K factor RskA
MEMMDYSEDHIALAAEYALGTLDAEERAQVETMMSADTNYKSVVEAWEFRLGVLNQMVGSVEPRPEVWDKIRSAVGFSETSVPPAAPVPAPEINTPQVKPPRIEAPEIEVRPAVSMASPVIAAVDIPPDASNLVFLSARARRWRNLATLTTAIAAVLLALIGVDVYQPDLVPEPLRPKPRTRIVEVKAPPAPIPASAEYVAILQRDGGSPAFILTVDAATKRFTVRKLGATAEPGKSFELWLISDKLPRPRSLGVIGNGDFTTRPVLASYDSEIVTNATYAVTVEQAGGSTDGNPHSAPVFAGKLIETVPPPR